MTFFEKPSSNSFFFLIVNTRFADTDEDGRGLGQDSKVKLNVTHKHPAKRPVGYSVLLWHVKYIRYCGSMNYCKLSLVAFYFSAGPLPPMHLTYSGTLCDPIELCTVWLYIIQLSLLMASHLKCRKIASVYLHKMLLLCLLNCLMCHYDSIKISKRMAVLNTYA